MLLALLYKYTYWVLLPLLTFAAWRYAGRAERAFAIIHLVALIATQIMKLGSFAAFRFVEVGVLTIDALTIVAVGVLAIRTGYLWIICAAALHLLALTGHLARLMDPTMSRMAYSLMASASAYPTLILLAIGIALAHRRSESGLDLH